LAASGEMTNRRVDDRRKNQPKMYALWCATVLMNLDGDHYLETGVVLDNFQASAKWKGLDPIDGMARVVIVNMG
jgi:hypothetical protein